MKIKIVQTRHTLSRYDITAYSLCLRAIRPGRTSILAPNGIKCPHDLVGFGIIKLETMEDRRGTFLGQASANNDVGGEVE